MYPGSLSAIPAFLTDLPVLVPPELPEREQDILRWHIPCFHACRGPLPSGEQSGGGSLTIRKKLVFPKPLKERRISIALLLFLLEQLVAGAGAGQEQPEVLGNRGAGLDASFPSGNFQESSEEGRRRPRLPPTQTFLPSTLYCVGMKHMNSQAWPVISQSEKSSTGAWTCWARRKSRRLRLMFRESLLKGRCKE